MTDEPQRVVVADASVLINLIHVNRLDLCQRLPGLEFVVPDHVRAEIKYPHQREALDRAVESGVFQIVSITDLNEIADSSNLTARTSSPTLKRMATGASAVCGLRTR